MRSPAVAGQFYEGDRDGLQRQVESCYTHRLGPRQVPRLDPDGPRRIRGLVVPHAGYMYSGPVAAHAYAALATDGVPPHVVIFGPNHTGLGAAMAQSTEEWRTPLGTVGYDREVGARILGDVVAEDATAHRFEHSIEVQLPFLQHLGATFRFVPICMGLQDYTSATDLGKRVRAAIRGTDALVLASTDFSHYVPKDLAAKKDRAAIDKILAFDVKGFDEVVRRQDISMCGYGPVMAMLTAVESGTPEFLKYASSGDVADMRDVVGYCSIAVRR